MKSSSKNKIEAILKMQINLNNEIVPNWKKENLDWKSAIIAEAGEFIESTDYKWWKMTHNDLENLKVEAIDLLHFLISYTVEVEQNKYVSEEELITKLASKYLNHFDIVTKKNNVLNKELHELLYHSLNGSPVIATYNLFNIFSILKMDIDEVYELYMAKNILNKYRQDRRYKTDTYIKEVNGIEDNIAILEIIKTQNKEKKTLSNDHIFKEMDTLGYGNTKKSENS